MVRDGFGFEALLAMSASSFSDWYAEWARQREAEAKAMKDAQRAR